MLSDTNARLVAARRLTGRRRRRETGLFLAEGAQAVREALATPGAVRELFATTEGYRAQQELLEAAGVPVDLVSERAAAALCETVNPQGLIAVCHVLEHSLAEVLATAPHLIVVLVEPNDPGNLGTIVRTADACGAAAVVVVGGVDPFNGKAVRASAGSVFHLPVLRATQEETFDRLDTAGYLTLATSGRGITSLDDIGHGELAGPTAWIFGNEATGLDQSVLDRSRYTVHVPISGRTESLNLAATAAICLYASARVTRSSNESGRPDTRRAEPDLTAGAG